MLNMHKQILFAHTCPFERLTSATRHLLSLQHCFLRPGPPNFGISLHDEQCPQFSREQAEHEPHRFLFFPVNVYDSKII